MTTSGIVLNRSREVGYQEIHSKRGARATRAAERKRQGLGGITADGNSNDDNEGCNTKEGNIMDSSSKEEDGTRR